MRRLTRYHCEFNQILETFDFSEYNAFHQAYPRIYHGTDKLGRPIYIERLGKIDHSKLSIITTPERMIRYHIYEYEKLIRYRFKACSAKAAVNIEQSTTILDLSGVSLSAFSSVVTLIRQISAIAQDYYPEVMGKMYILNAPMLFSAVWSLISPLLNAVTVSKISILGSSYKSNVLELINEGMLPDFLGGTVKHPTWIGVDSGPWNDGLTPGFPIEALEKAPIKSLK